MRDQAKCLSLKDRSDPVLYFGTRSSAFLCSPPSCSSRPIALPDCQARLSFIFPFFMSMMEVTGVETFPQFLPVQIERLNCIDSVLSIYIISIIKPHKTSEQVNKSRLPCWRTIDCHPSRGNMSAPRG